MEKLESIIKSSLFDQDLYTDGKFKFSLQIDPAILFILRDVVIENTLENAANDPIYDEEQLLDIIKHQDLIKKQLIAEIERISKINQEVKKLPMLEDECETERVEKLLNNADTFLLELKSILQEIIACK